jgi:hypothetical protein
VVLFREGLSEVIWRPGSESQTLDLEEEHFRYSNRRRGKLCKKGAQCYLVGSEGSKWLWCF